MIRTDTADHIEIWRVPSCNRVCLLNVKYDTSATTDAGGTVAFTSNHRQNGIRAYETSTGQEIWSRRDLGDRRIRLSKTFPLLYAFSKQSCDVLNGETGKSKRILRGVHELWESPYENTEFVEKKKRFYLLRDGKAKWSLERERFQRLMRCSLRNLCSSLKVAGICVAVQSQMDRNFGVSRHPADTIA